MPAINPSLVPTLNPGSMFTELTTDTTLNIRWLTPTDAVFFETLNRPTADIALRQLIIAKAIDALEVSLGYQGIFPFIIPPIVVSGSQVVNLPVRIFWDINVSIPVKWSDLRLMRIDRISGINGLGDSDPSDDYTGTLRFIFGAVATVGGGSETALFYADYAIDGTSTYQKVRISVATASTCPGLSPIATGEGVTIDGEIIFRTLDQTDTAVRAFYDLVQPGVSAYYELDDSTGANPDFSSIAVSHGTGMMTSSVCSLITPINSDPSTWITAFNYPFGIDADLISSGSAAVTIPAGLFSEFDMIVPAGDQPTGDSSGATFPIWVSKIERDGAASSPTLIFYFATYGVNPVDGTTAIEFATLTLDADMASGQAVGIIPDSSLYPNMVGSGWNQEFGRGHVILSNKWDISGGEVQDFFDAFPFIVGTTTSASFAASATRLSPLALSRNSRFTPTAGQSAALFGTGSDRTTPLYPGQNNKFVTALDEGLGDMVDLHGESGITANAAIDRYGYAGTRVHQTVKLVVDPAAATTADFYDVEILPRLRILFGRDPVFGDEWFNGNRFMRYSGDAWIG